MRDCIHANCDLLMSRTILRDRHGATDEVEKKRPRTNNAQANKARNGVAKGKAMNIKKNNKKPVEKKEEDKKDEEKKDQESAENAEVKKEDEEKMDQDESKPEEKKASKYDEFSTSLLVCKVCQKVMNDGSVSFAREICSKDGSCCLIIS